MCPIGPAAPVPPQVAIPRPTAAELAQVNQPVKMRIDSDQSGQSLNVATAYKQTPQRIGARL